MRTHRITRMAMAAGLALSATPTLAQPQQDLPISEITLYRSGVGHFVRSGIIDDDADVTLTFQTEQVNDILKSMYLLDLGGGRIEAVSYASREPLEKRLASFAIDISDMPDLPTLLGRLRGAQIAVETVDGRTTGTVLGVESRTEAVRETGIQMPYINLLTSDGIESIRVAGVSSFRILDEQLATELEKALAILAEHRADTVKSVDLSFRGEGARQAVVAYVHEMPVWKTSYRLILPDETGGEPTIQGWAIVENTTDSDWQDVRLSLVAGQPVGFTMDLYQPLFIPRPEVPVPVIRGLAPRVYKAGAEYARPEPDFEQAQRQGERGRAGGDGGGQSALQDSRGFRSDAGRSITGEDIASYAARAQASAAEIGEVFQYRVDAPVSIERQQSAMLPILSAAIDGRRVSIYNADQLDDHPMRGIDLTNSSGLQLMPGPIAVFDGPAFAGDAQIGHLPEGDDRLISYAVDLNVDARVEHKNESRVERVRIVNGVLEQINKSVREAEYTFTNKDTDRSRALIVEHSKMSGWELVAPDEPKETTDSLYRFELEIPSGENGTLTVRQERVQRSRYELTEFDRATLLRLHQTGRASEEVLTTFRDAMRLRDRVAEVEARIERLEDERQSITRDQDRIRENMGRVNRDSDLYRRYMTKLSEQETRLETIGSELAEARDLLETRKRELKSFLRDLDIE